MHPVKAVGDDSEVISIEVGAEVIDINVIAQEPNIEWKIKDKKTAEAVQRCEVKYVTGLRTVIMTPGNQHIF